MAAAEALKKKIQELMSTRDDAIEKGDALDMELNELKEQLLKADFEKKEIERRFKLTSDELDHQITLQDDLEKKNGNLIVEDERIKADMKAQEVANENMENLIQVIDEKYLILEEEYNATMEDINAL